MAMRWLESELRGTGNKQDEAFADQLLEIRKLRGDIPFPSEEMPATQKFTDRAREGLESKGNLIYDLTGQSISTQRDKGYTFFSSWHLTSRGVETMTSLFSEVAIDPEMFFIPESNDKSFEEQLEMVKKYGKELLVPDTKAVIGEAPDYIELAFLHLDRTGDRLFGEKYNNRFTVTQTLFSGQRINVGHFVPDEGIVVNNLLSDRSRREQVFAAPLIVPSSYK